MKKILGLDLGTNSIGWALVEQKFDAKQGHIIDLGSRIIPMSKDVMDKFGTGQTVSQTAARTDYRSVRRLTQRNVLRRERLHRVLNILNFLPEHYVDAIDFDKHPGQFKLNKEVKLNYKPYEENSQIKYEFIFKDSFQEMCSEFKEKKPNLFRKKKNGEETKIAYDWTIYYLRTKAIKEKISEQELAWLILHFNQKRGYYQLRGEEESIDKSKKEEFFTLKVTEIEETQDKNEKGTWYNITLENDWVYRRQSKDSLQNWIGKNKDFIVTTQLEQDGSPKKDKEGDIKRNFRVDMQQNNGHKVKLCNI